MMIWSTWFILEIKTRVSLTTEGFLALDELVTEVTENISRIINNVIINCLPLRLCN